MEALTLQGNGGSRGGGGPQRMIDEEESTVDVEEKRKGRVVKGAQPPWIKLGLGTATDSATAQNPVTEHRKPVVLTTAQLHELQGQALIYKHLEAGLPVPLHLLLPIWKSVASCFGPSIYKLYPSFVGCFSPQGFDYRTMMDPEPGRCRRTDGKKWRCSKNAIPDQKYCERHMHRGRQRSRKPVEAFGSSSAPGSTPLDKSNNKLGELSRTHANSVPVGLQLMTPTSSNTATNHNSSTTTSSWSNMGSKRSVSSETITTRHPYPSISAATTTLPTTASMPPIASLETISTFNPNPIDKIEDNSERKDISSNHMVYTTCLKSSSNKIVSLGLGFSPKSVLQVQACNSSCLGNRNGFELEPGRCRRTDGKKWRCSRDVVPDRKYCTQHMHRGAKKRTIASQTISVPAPPTSASHRVSPYRINIHKEADLPFPNTDLSISIQASPQLMHDDGKSPTSSSSDTTITDTSITANVYGYVSS